MALCLIGCDSRCSRRLDCDRLDFAMSVQHAPQLRTIAQSVASVLVLPEHIYYVGMQWRSSLVEAAHPLDWLATSIVRCLSKKIYIDV